MRRVLTALLIGLWSAFTQAGPVALVEDIGADQSGVELLDYLSSGDTVDLGASGTMTLGYLNSCTREEITGGQVTVGQERSQLSGGTVQRSQTQCDGTRLALAADQAMQSGAVAMRDMFDTKPKLTVYDISPLLVTTQDGRIVIKRIDEKGERYTFEIETGPSGKYLLDLAEQDIALAKSGTYMISGAGKTLVFKVASDAVRDKNKTLSRIIPL